MEIEFYFRFIRKPKNKRLTIQVTDQHVPTTMTSQIVITYTHFSPNQETGQA